MKNIVFTGGGSGGHIMPNIAIIEQLQGYKIYYFGTNGMEKNILKNYPHVTFVEIPAVKLVRSLTPKNLLIPFKLIKSINFAKKKLKNINPSLIFSKGGFVSIPTCLAGNKLNIPVLTHESDLTVGLANKIISKKATHLCCSFKETADNYKKNAIYTGSPIRKKILEGKKDIVFARHKIPLNKPIILVVGGSLGAKTINQAIWDNLEKLQKDYIIFHIVGRGKINKTIKNSSTYFQFEFLEDIENYFSASDIVISRAGSNTIFELLTLKKPMILIPLSKKSSRGDQILNANNFEEKGFSKTIKEENLNYENLNNAILYTIKNKDKIISNMQKSYNISGNTNLINLINKFSK